MGSVFMYVTIYYVNNDDPCVLIQWLTTSALFLTTRIGTYQLLRQTDHLNIMVH